MSMAIHVYAICKLQYLVLILFVKCPLFSNPITFRVFGLVLNLFLQHFRGIATCMCGITSSSPPPPPPPPDSHFEKVNHLCPWDWGKVITPLKLREWVRGLECHLDRDFAEGVWHVRLPQGRGIGGRGGFDKSACQIPLPGAKSSLFLTWIAQKNRLTTWQFTKSVV